MKKTIRDYDLKDKKVIIRCDFNVPMKDGVITDNNRIAESINTIKYALDNGAKVILLSHLGRVKEEKDLKENDLAPVAQELSNLLNKKVVFSHKTRGPELEDAINKLSSGEVLLIQNTRYEDLEGKKESSNDEELGAYWASLGDLFINDAFGTLHRAHASNVGISSHLPNGVGLLIEKELTELEKLNNPERPFVIIMGGAKVEDKIGVIENLAAKADKIVIGGGMAFTFLKAQGINVGLSKVEDEQLEFCKKMLDLYPDKLVLPVDVNVTTEFSNDTDNRITSVNSINDNEMGLDIGPETVNLINSIIDLSKTVFWNGPLGVYEFSKYKEGTEKVMEHLANSGVISILGGGDIVSCATNMGFKDKVTHASTGGGATLEYLEGKELPGIAAISDK